MTKSPRAANAAPGDRASRAPRPSVPTASWPARKRGNWRRISRKGKPRARARRHEAGDALSEPGGASLYDASNAAIPAGRDQVGDGRQAVDPDVTPAGGREPAQRSAGKGAAPSAKLVPPTRTGGLAGRSAVKSRSSQEAVAKHRGAGVAPARAAATKPAPAGAKAKPAAKADIPPAEKGRPAAIAKPRKPDDLKLISGVGPKIEAILNGLGIYTYAQIASWKKTERAWVDGYLRFSGRIEREDWVRQAKALAKGGVEEYIRVFGRKPR